VASVTGISSTIRGSFTGMYFRGATTTIDRFEERHRRLSTSPDSGS